MVGVEPSVGEVFGSYRVEGVLGRGGMAMVVLARHVELGTLHALKIPQIVAEGLLERFILEGRLQAHLRHPNIVAVTDVVRVGPLPGLVMEFVQGPNLRVLLERYTPNLQQIDLIADQIMGAVAHAHGRGVVHRDLKPENVLLAVEGDEVLVKVSDFGLAKVIGEFPGGARQHPTRSGQTMGTPAYMAPEQQSDAMRVDHRADVFSLGALLYELVTGVPAFTGVGVVEVFNRVASGQFRPLQELAPSAPERFSRAVRCALRPDPRERPQSVAELLALWRDGTEAPDRAWEPSHVSLLRTLAPLPSFARGTPAMAGDLPRTASPTLAVEPGVELASPPMRTPARPVSEPSAPPPTEAPARGRVVAVMLVGLLVGLGLAGWLVGRDVAAPPVASAPPPGPVLRAEASPPTEPTPAAVPPAPVPAVTRARPVEAPPEAPVEAAPAAPPVESARVVVVREDPPVESAPAPAVSSAGRARVQVQGVRRAWLVTPGGERFQVSEWVPPGGYTLLAWFDEDSPTPALDLVLQPDEERTITCNRGLRVCR